MNVSLADLPDIELPRRRRRRARRTPPPARAGSRAPARSRCPARPAGPDDPVGVLQRAGDGADQPVAAERDRHLARGRGGHGELARVLEAPGPLDAVVEAERGAARRARSASARAARPPPADGLTISDSSHEPSTSEWRSSAIATGSGSVGRLGLGAGGHTGEHDRAVEAGGGGSGQVRVEPVADHERPARLERSSAVAKICGVGLARDLRRARRSRTRAPPRSRPSRAPCRPRSGNVRSRLAAIISAPASTA